jgi:N-acetylmuramoyl-L-alanine amidase
MTIWQKLSSTVQSLGANGGAVLEHLARLTGHSGGLVDGRTITPDLGPAFTIAMIALAAKMAKADGIVAPVEIEAFKRVIKIPPSEAANVGRLFKLAQQDVAGFEAYADQIRLLLRGDHMLLRDVLDSLFFIASADRAIHPAESSFLETVAERFGLSASEYKYVRAHFIEDEASPYDILGVDPSASDAELKKRHRRLVRENHPDLAMGRGVPRDVIDAATRKLASINDYLKGARAMTFKPDSPFDVQVYPAANVEDRRDGRRPDMLLLHYTGMRSAAKAVEWLARADSKVSCHYVIDECGAITQMVPESQRAWHAGVSCWQGDTDINSASIGFEIQNPGHDMGYHDFSDAQVESVIRLGLDIVGRWGIAPERVLAHSDVAPQRKIDPGEKFPWHRLAQAGLGAWVEPSPVYDGASALQMGNHGASVRAAQSLLAQYGYDVSPNGTFGHRTFEAVRAFQRHFRPARVDGRIDLSTLSTLERLVTLLNARKTV